MSTPEWTFAKAESIGGEEIRGVVIRITGDLPPAGDLPSAERFYSAQSSLLAEALYLSLPQGTFDRLLLDLLRKKVSPYRGRTE